MGYIWDMKIEKKKTVLPEFDAGFHRNYLFAIFSYKYFYFRHNRYYI